MGQVLFTRFEYPNWSGGQIGWRRFEVQQLVIKKTETVYWVQDTCHPNLNLEFRIICQSTGFLSRLHLTPPFFLEVAISFGFECQ